MHNTHTIWKTIHCLSIIAPPTTLTNTITFNTKITTTPKHNLIDGNKENISKGGKIMIKMIKENNMIILISLENVEENGQEVVEGTSQ